MIYGPLFVCFSFLLQVKGSYKTTKFDQIQLFHVGDFCISGLCLLVWFEVDGAYLVGDKKVTNGNCRMCK